MQAITATIARVRRASLLRRISLLTASLAVSLLAACGGGGGDGAATAPEPTGRGTLRLSNVSSLSAYYVYVKSCNSSSWGPDRMGSGILSSGESATLQLDAGCWDLRAKTSNTNNKRFDARGLQVGNAQTLQVNITSWTDD